MELIDLQAQQARIRASIDGRIRAVLDHGRYLMGPEVEVLEQRLADAADVPHCLTVSSGTDALLIALLALGIGPGDEVLTPSFTFVATAESVALTGATPRFADIEPDTYNLDANRLEAAITARTRAIIVVDLFGQCADYPEIGAIAERHGLAVIEDAAQSFGARLNDRPAGSFGHIACTSFFPAKPLGGYGDGGACFTADPELARIMTEIRLHGQSDPYAYARVGINGRLDTLQAAILLAKLEIFEDEIRLRQEVAERYQACLPDWIQRPQIRPGRQSVWAQYTIETDRRDRVRQCLQEQGIPTGVYYPHPLHRQPPYRQEIFLPVTEAAAKRVLSLPMHPYLTAANQDQVARALGAAGDE